VVELGRESRPIRARLASAGERERLWPPFLAAPGYADYQRATTREIPVVILEPRI
jgi:hypothetical protein